MKAEIEEKIAFKKVLSVSVYYKCSHIFDMRYDLE